MAEEKIHISFNVRFNWPPGKNSFGGFGTNVKIIEKEIKAVVAAKEKEDDKPITFNEFAKGPLKLSEISETLRNNASVGRYLTGDFFIIEIYNKDNKPMKGTKINMITEKPAHASGPTSVDRDYFLEI